MRQACPSTSSKPSNFPLIKFVPEGYIPPEPINAQSSTSLVRRGVVVAPSVPLSLRRLKGRYPRGFCQVYRMGWERLLGGLGPNQGGISTPLCVKFHPMVSILERTKIVGDVFEHGISTLQQRPSDSPPDFGSCSLLPHISISIFGRELLALLDSGREMTCMNEEEFSALSSGRRIANQSKG